MKKLIVLILLSLALSACPPRDDRSPHASSCSSGCQRIYGAMSDDDVAECIDKCRHDVAGR